MVRGRDIAGMAGSKAMVSEMVCASCWILTSLTRYSSDGYSMFDSRTLQHVSSWEVFMKTSVLLLVVNTLSTKALDACKDPHQHVYSQSVEVVCPCVRPQVVQAPVLATLTLGPVRHGAQVDAHGPRQE